MVFQWCSFNFPVVFSCNGEALDQLKLGTCSLTFTSDNWGVAQEIQLVAVDDAKIDSAHGRLTFTASGGEYNDHGTTLTVSLHRFWEVWQLGSNRYEIMKNCKIQQRLAQIPIINPRYSEDHGMFKMPLHWNSIIHCVIGNSLQHRELSLQITLKRSFFKP